MNEKSSMAGWVLFAGCAMVIVGCVDFFQGLIALFEDEYFVVSRSGYLVVDLTTWGWVFADLGSDPLLRRPRPDPGARLGPLVRDLRDLAEHLRPARLPRKRDVPALGTHRHGHQHRRALRADRTLEREQGGARAVGITILGAGAVRDHRRRPRRSPVLVESRYPARARSLFTRVKGCSPDPRAALAS